MTPFWVSPSRYQQYADSPINFLLNSPCIQTAPFSLVYFLLPSFPYIFFFYLSCSFRFFLLLLSSFIFFFFPFSFLLLSFFVYVCFPPFLLSCQLIRPYQILFSGFHILSLHLCLLVVTLAFPPKKCISFFSQSA